jgi:hypothetical protein
MTFHVGELESAMLASSVSSCSHPIGILYVTSPFLRATTRREMASVL